MHKTVLSVIFCGMLFLAKRQRYSFKNDTTHGGLVQTDISDIRQDKKGNTWIGTRNGLLKCNDSCEVSFKPNAANNNLFICLTTNWQNPLLFVCNNEIFQVRSGKIDNVPGERSSKKQPADARIKPEKRNQL